MDAHPSTVRAVETVLYRPKKIVIGAVSVHRFLLPAEGWEVYKRGSLSVCLSVSQSVSQSVSVSQEL